MSSLEDAQQLNTLYWIERHITVPSKWGLLISGLALLSYWNWESLRPTPTAAITLAAYALLNIVFTVIFVRGHLPLQVAKLLALASYACDFLYIAYLIFGLGGVASQLAFLMYVILMLKSGLYYPVLKESFIVLPVAIGAYLGLLGLTQGLDVFSSDSLKPRYFLLVAIPAVTAYTAHLFAGRERDLSQLSDQLQASSADLRQQTRELHAVIQSMHDGLLVSDASFNVITLNPVARRILRLGSASPAPSQLATSDNGQALLGLVAEAIASPEGTSRREVQLPLPNEGEDEPRTYQAVASFVAGERKANGQVVVILRDITEQQRLEFAKSNFLSVVSHELRTPMTSIKGFLDLILNGRAGTLTDLQRDFLTTVSGQAESLLVMVGDLVEFSRIQVRRNDVAADPVSLADVARVVAARLMPLASEREIIIIHRSPPDLPPVQGDRLQLEQVVSNLVSNAIKFTPDRGTITLSARSEGNEVVFSVVDTGIGIPADQQEQIFEAFYQISTGATRLHGGMGLGLAICRHIVEGHGGRLWVQSEEGKGSEFQFALPTFAVPQNSTGLQLAQRS